MNELQIFKNDQFGEIRTVEIGGEPWFVWKDIADKLGYSNPRDAIYKHVDPEDKGASRIATTSGEQDMTIINESGLYSLVLSSKLPTAKQFKRWVTSEVIPSIRKHGGYIHGQETMTDAELMAKALLVANRQIEERQKRIDTLEEKAKLDAPKVLFASAVETAKTSILVGDLAKILKQNGVDIGQNRLFQWLRDNGWLIKDRRSDYNSPTQKGMNQGLFEVKEGTVINPDGSVRVTKTTKVTGKGQLYFTNLFLGGQGN
jgi:anti-repressor protein